jgi:hypothetical protein
LGKGSQVTTGLWSILAVSSRAIVTFTSVSLFSVLILSFLSIERDRLTTFWSNLEGNNKLEPSM